MKKIIGIFVLTFLLHSCDRNESTVFDSSSQNLISFAQSTSNLAIVLDGVGQDDVIINVTNLSSVDRTVTIEVLDESTADPENYSIPLSVVIPANEYFGVLTISGTDVSAETTPEIIVLKIASVSGDDNAVFSPTTHEVSVFQSCPVDVDKFIGSYLIEETTPFVDGPTLSDNTIIELKHLNPASPTTERKFSTKNYPNYCSPFRDFFFNLSCGEVIVRANQASTCTCTADGMFFGPAIVPSNFDAEDDSVFFMTFTNDVTGDCSDPVQTTYKFTKQ